MKIIDGNKIAEEQFVSLQKEITTSGLVLTLAVFVVGNNPLSAIYVKKKQKLLTKYQINVNVYTFPEIVNEEDLVRKIKGATEDGVIVQLPLPVGIIKKNILEAIPSSKDVDVFSAQQVGNYYLGVSNIVPPVPLAVKVILESSDVSVKGKRVVLVGGGEMVGKPLTVMLIREGATVMVVNEHTPEIEEIIKQGDIVVSGAGVPKLIKGEMIKEGAVVIDAGTSVVSDKLEGDVDISSVGKKPSLLAKVPGGVGPVTVYALARNLFEIKKQNL